VTATITCPHLYFKNAWLSFEDDTTASQRSGLNVLNAGTGIVTFDGTGGINATLNYDNNAMDKLACDEVYTRGPGGTANTTFNLNQVGTATTGFWLAIDTNNNEHDDFPTYSGATGTTQSWSNGDLSFGHM
jgi:hypothetical protein